MLRNQLTPTGRFGSKRPLVSLQGFFDVLQKENVHIITNPITTIDANGVITRAPSPTNDAIAQMDTTHATANRDILTKADVLIWGTGFVMQGWGGAVHTIGRSGITLSDHWGAYPRTLFGM